MAKRLSDLTGTTKSGPRYRPDHDRIVRGVPFQGQAEEPCPGPVDAREWTPEPHETYPNGVWERMAFMTGNADQHGGAVEVWVHCDYKARLGMRRYQTVDGFGVER